MGVARVFWIVWRACTVAPDDISTLYEGELSNIINKPHKP